MNNLSKYLILMTIIGSSLVSVAAIGGTRLKISVPFEGKSEIDIQVMPGNSARLVLEGGALSISLQDGKTQDLFSGMVKEERLFGQWGLHFDDFNMDGYQDFAVDISYGYGGVNVFSDIYTFNANTGRFEKILEEVSNIQADPSTKTLRTSMKSGPRYISENYRFTNGKPYKYSKQLVMFNGLDLVTIFDEPGNAIRKLVVDPADNEAGSGEFQPAVRKVLTKRAWLYKSANDNAKTRSYLIEGDEVEIHDAAGDQYEWLKIHFKAKKKTIIRWMKAENLLEEGF